MNGRKYLQIPEVKGRNPGAFFSKASQHRSESSHLGATYGRAVKQRGPEGIWSFLAVSGRFYGFRCSWMLLCGKRNHFGEEELRYHAQGSRNGEQARVKDHEWVSLWVWAPWGSCGRWGRRSGCCGYKSEKCESLCSWALHPQSSCLPFCCFFTSSLFILGKVPTFSLSLK